MADEQRVGLPGGGGARPPGVTAAFKVDDSSIAKATVTLKGMVTQLKAINTELLGITRNARGVDNLVNSLNRLRGSGSGTSSFGAAHGGNLSPGAFSTNLPSQQGGISASQSRGAVMLGGGLSPGSFSHPAGSQSGNNGSKNNPPPQPSSSSWGPNIFRQKSGVFGSGLSGGQFTAAASLGGLAAGGSYIANHMQNITDGDLFYNMTARGMPQPGGSFSKNVNSVRQFMFGQGAARGLGGFTSTQDMLQGAGTLMPYAGTFGSSTSNSLFRQTAAFTALNPGGGFTGAANAVSSLYSPQQNFKLMGMGIGGSIGAGGVRQSPTQIAQSFMSRVFASVGGKPTLDMINQGIQPGAPLYMSLQNFDPDTQTYIINYMRASAKVGSQKVNTALSNPGSSASRSIRKQVGWGNSIFEHQASLTQSQSRFEQQTGAQARGSIEGTMNDLAGATNAATKALNNWTGDLLSSAGGVASMAKNPLGSANSMLGGYLQYSLFNKILSKGGVGGVLGGSGGTAAGGGLLSSAMGKIGISGGALTGAGAAAGASIMAGTAIQHIGRHNGKDNFGSALLGDTAKGAGIGAAAGLIGGPLAPLTSSVGAAIGAGVGGAIGLGQHYLWGRKRTSVPDVGGGASTGGSAGGGAHASAAAGSGMAAQILAIEEHFKGTPYRYGGSSPQTGFDCSGLTQWAFAQKGVQLPRTAAQQQQVGQPVAPQDLQPGDLIFYGSPAHHVGTYAGNGVMFEAPHTGDVLKFANIGGYTNARRVLGGKNGPVGAPAGGSGASGMSGGTGDPGRALNSVSANPSVEEVTALAAALSGGGGLSSGSRASTSAGSSATSAMPSGSAAGGAGKPPSGNLAAWIRTALGVLHKPYAQFASGLNNMIKHESGGNPGAVNRTDSNAAAGHPSFGLMQTIPSTFNAYSLPGYKNMHDPVSQIIAGFRYAEANYGDGMIQQGGRKNSAGNYIGYARGSWEIVRDELAQVHKGEMVVPKPTAEALRSLVNGGGRSGGSTIQIIVQMPVQVMQHVSESEMERVLGAMKSSVENSHQLRSIRGLGMAS